LQSATPAKVPKEVDTSVLYLQLVLISMLTTGADEFTGLVIQFMIEPQVSV
jgi:hypothetical protein